MSVRCRVAPSPSGFLHIGTAKIALFNWLFARSQGGVFVLRLEDTDAERTDEAFVEAMCEGFRWLGIDWDEGPAFGGVPEKGAYGPYRQSLRREMHRREAFRLLEEGKAYPCFCSKETLEADRERAMAEKRPYRYSGRCRAIPPEEARRRMASGEPCAIRLKTPDEGETIVRDLVQGEVRFDNHEFDDFIILRPSGDPIFHLAVVADDAHMKITHVIRGDDHLTNTPKHIMLFEALGYPVPTFAHLPMVLDETGKKYSKRMHGANVLDWRDAGYLPEAIINYVVMLGWTPEEEGREFFTRDELVRLFTIHRLNKSPARFDRARLDWLNGQHIRRLAPGDLRDRVLPILRAAGLDPDTRSPEWLTEMAAICQEKIPTLNHIVDYVDFFFRDVTSYDEKAARKFFAQPDSAAWLEAARRAVTAAEPWSVDALKERFQAEAEAVGAKIGSVVNAARLALTGKPVGPGLYELTRLLGRETALERLRRALEYVREIATIPAATPEKGEG